jgi:S-adenosylmethionine:tRNA ribosyltransferase-isomerase
MDVTEFDYELSSVRIAQTPLERRDTSRLLVVTRDTGAIEERLFCDLPQLLCPGDVLAINDTWVIPARLYGAKIGGGATIEVLLLEDLGDRRWKVIAQRACRLYPGARIQFPEGVVAEVGAILGDGLFELSFSGETRWEDFLNHHGRVPLPPYIHRSDGCLDMLDRERYQTVYARPTRHFQSAAAPTAGLHFTDELLARLEGAGILIVRITLRIGLDTFLPIRSARVEDHPMHRETYVITEESAEEINRARAGGGRIIAVGTTVVRALESAAGPGGQVKAQRGETALFITPGYIFRAIDGIVTNFHLPRSTLLVLIASWLGKDKWRMVYDEAIRRGFRFYSYGDAMLAW